MFFSFHVLESQVFQNVVWLHSSTAVPHQAVTLRPSHGPAGTVVVLTSGRNNSDCHGTMQGCDWSWLIMIDWFIDMGWHGKLKDSSRFPNSTKMLYSLTTGRWNVKFPALSQDSVHKEGEGKKKSGSDHWDLRKSTGTTLPVKAKCSWWSLGWCLGTLQSIVTRADPPEYQWIKIPLISDQVEVLRTSTRIIRTYQNYLPMPVVFDQHDMFVNGSMVDQWWIVTVSDQRLSVAEAAAHSDMHCHLQLGSCQCYLKDH